MISGARMVGKSSTIGHANAKQNVSSEVKVCVETNTGDIKAVNCAAGRVAHLETTLQTQAGLPSKAVKNVKQQEQLALQKAHFSKLTATMESSCQPPRYTSWCNWQMHRSMGSNTGSHRSLASHSLCKKHERKSAGYHVA